MTIEQLIKEKIKQNFDPVYYEVINESHKHKGHAGDNGTGQTHFKLLVVSDHFEGCNLVQRQRLVLDCLNPLFENGLHALSLKLFTEKERKK